MRAGKKHFINQSITILFGNKKKDGKEAVTTRAGQKFWRAGAVSFFDTARIGSVEQI